MKKIVKNYNDANKLIKLGYKLLEIDRNPVERSKLIFIFEYKDGIVESLKSFERK